MDVPHKHCTAMMMSCIEDLVKRIQSVYIVTADLQLAMHVASKLKYKDTIIWQTVAT